MRGDRAGQVHAVVVFLPEWGAPVSSSLRCNESGCFLYCLTTSSVFEDDKRHIMWFNAVSKKKGGSNRVDESTDNKNDPFGNNRSETTTEVSDKKPAPPASLLYFCLQNIELLEGLQEKMSHCLLELEQQILLLIYYLE